MEPKTSPLLDHAADHWPPAARAKLPAVIREVLRAIAPRLGPESWKAVAAAVGEAALSEAELEPTQLATLSESVAEASGVRGTMAVELTQMVFLALGRALDPRARERLAGELPPPWSGMLAHGDDEALPLPPTAVAPGTAGDHTLASGHPGADRPLSSAAPARGQRDSVAVADDPHGDRKLASTTGDVPRERTIAGGRSRRS